MAYWVLMQAAKESGHIYPWMDTLVEFGPDAPMRGAGWQLVHHSGTARRDSSLYNRYAKRDRLGVSIPLGVQVPTPVFAFFSFQGYEKFIYRTPQLVAKWSTCSSSTVEHAAWRPCLQTLSWRGPMYKTKNGRRRTLRPRRLSKDLDMNQIHICSTV